jgi:hypothetical protein
MKRSLLVIAALAALGSASVYAQTAGVQPSFNDYVDLNPIPLTATQTKDQNFPKGSMNGSGGPTGPATVVVDGRQGNAQYANSSAGATRSDATSSGAPASDDRTGPTLNDSFHYPSSN